MTILALDTSAKAASVSLATEDRLIGEFFINTDITHSQTLVPMIEQLCQNACTPLSEVEAIAVNAGPGSFTGVRIGVAAAKGLAFRHDLPCVSVSTLESMAYNLLGADGVVCAVMDARCAQVYNALFRVKGNAVERLCEDRALALAELKAELEHYTETVYLVGDGASITAQFLENALPNVISAPIHKAYQSASSVVLAAFERIKQGHTMTPDELMPVYLRLPQAQRELNKKRGVQS